VPLAVAPSAVWRLPLAFGFSMGTLRDGEPVQVHGGEAVYIVGLSIVLEGLALLTLGLVRPWGERVPGWFPLLGGRRLPPRLVVGVAGTGAVLLALILATAFRDFPSLPEMEFSNTGWHVLLVACYLPLLLWPPLLAAVTFSYHRRHRPSASFATGATREVAR
jgi:hypothetical protein